MMSDEEIAALAADIKEHGLKEPIKLIGPHKGRQQQIVIDGRNRLAALDLLGVQFDRKAPEYSEGIRTHPGSFDDPFEYIDRVDDPAAFVIALNIRRRHLTKEERPVDRKDDRSRESIVQVLRGRSIRRLRRRWLDEDQCSRKPSPKRRSMGSRNARYEGARKFRSEPKRPPPPRKRETEELRHEASGEAFHQSRRPRSNDLDDVHNAPKREERAGRSSRDVRGDDIFMCLGLRRRGRRYGSRSGRREAGTRARPMASVNRSTSRGDGLREVP
jgi:hypothetical protein